MRMILHGTENKYAAEWSTTDSAAGKCLHQDGHDAGFCAFEPTGKLHLTASAFRLVPRHLWLHAEQSRAESSRATHRGFSKKNPQQHLILHGTTPAVCLSRRLWVRHAQDHAIMIAKCSCFCYGEWFCIHDARVDAFACFFLSKLAPSSTKHALKY